MIEFEGPMPSSVDGFSFWATILAPIAESEKLLHLKSTDTLRRLHIILDSFGMMLHRRGLSVPSQSINPSNQQDDDCAGNSDPDNEIDEDEDEDEDEQVLEDEDT